MNRKDWFYVGGGTAVSAALVGGAALVRRRKVSAQTASGASAGGTSAASTPASGGSTAAGQGNTSSPANSSSGSSAKTQGSGAATHPGIGGSVTIQWQKKKPRGTSEDIATAQAPKTLVAGETLNIVAEGTDLSGVTVVASAHAGHKTAVWHAKGGPGNSVTAWAELVQNGKMVSQSRKVTATWETSSGKTASVPGQSPRGNSASGPSTPCPSEYTAQLVPGYGWTCNETLAQKEKNRAKVVAQTGAGGSTIGGIDQSQAASYRQLFEQKYGGTYVIQKTNSGYSILPQAALITHPSASSTLSATTNRLVQATGSQNVSENQGLANLKAAGATPKELANYLMQHWGYDAQIAASTADSVATTGKKNGQTLPSPTSTAKQQSGAVFHVQPQQVTSSQASGAPGVPPTAQDKYGDSKSGKITPAQAKKLFEAGKLPGPGFVVNGEWFQNIDQIPPALRSKA